MREVSNIIEEYEKEIELLLKELNDIDVVLEQVMNERNQAIKEAKEYRECLWNLDELVSKDEELDTKRSYMLRPSTAALLKKVKKVIYAESDVTMNELADEAIQIYCKIAIEKFRALYGEK